MRVEVDVCAGEAASLVTERRLRFVLARFAGSLAAVVVRVAAAGPGRLRLSGRVTLVGGETVVLAAEDDASEAATLHFIDRLGRTVARRCSTAGGQLG